MSLPELPLGYQSALFTHFPLPRTNVGTTFSREYNGQRVSYVCEFGVPYKLSDRRMLEILTTLVVKKRDSEGRWDGRIELGRISHILQDYGMARNGQYIKPMAEALFRLSNLGVTVAQTGIVKGIHFARTRPFFLAKDAQVCWAPGTLKKVAVQPELDGLTYFVASDGFLDITKNALPHDQRHVMDITSPLELELYYQFNAKAPNLEESKVMMPWNWFYAQYGEPDMNESQMKSLRRKIKDYILHIKTAYLPKMKLELKNEGVLLYKSAPFIEPSNKFAGYLP